MIACDQYVTEFIGKNWLTLGFIFGFLKILASRSQNTMDDSIISYVTEFLSGFRRQKTTPTTETLIG
jgi:hypothetical protein